MDEATFNSQSRSRCPLFFTVVPHLLGIATIAFFVIATAVDDWSEGSYTQSSTENAGTYDIGLWRACSSDESVFYSGGLCRNGHCHKYQTLIEKPSIDSNVWNSHDLCDNAAATQGFMILSIFSATLAVWFSSVPAALGWNISWGVTTFFHALTSLFSLCAWAIWIAWQNTMNDDNLQGNPVNFSDMETGNGWNLALAGFVLSFFNMWFCRHRYVLYSRFLNRKKENKDRLTENATDVYDENAVSDMYLDVEQPPKRRSSEKQQSAI